MYTKESSQQPIKLPNNNLDRGFQRAHQNHNHEILDQKGELDKL